MYRLFAYKILHLSFHQGCIQDFEYVARELKLDLTSTLIQQQEPHWLDGITTALVTGTT